MKYRTRSPQQIGWIGAHQAIGPLLNSCGAFGILSYCKTGHTQDGCFLLHAARVRNHYSSATHKAQKFQIP